METYLRKYFWVIYLVTITICCYFAANSVSHYISANLPIAPFRVQSNQDAVVTSLLQTASKRDVTPILSRNIFCAECEPIQPLGVVATAQSQEPSENLTNREPVKSTLNLRLIATMVSDSGSQWSYAAIEDPDEKRTRMYQAGSSLGKEAVVVDILDRRVILHNAGRPEFIELAYETQEAPPQRRDDLAVASPSASSGPPDELSGFGQGVKKLGEGRYEIERSALEKVLSNTHLLARQARIVPSVKDGKPNGFKLFGVRGGSVYSQIGLQNGDTINAINGVSMTSPDKALEMYTKLRNASHLTVSFERRNQTTTYDYTIR